MFASNAFAILGLRSLYFLLGGMQGKFRYLNIGLGVILAFVGIKMLLIGEPFEVHLPTYVSLGFIALVLTVSIVASLRADKRDPERGLVPAEDTRRRPAVERLSPTECSDLAPYRALTDRLRCGSIASRRRAHGRTGTDSHVDGELADAGEEDVEGGPVEPALGDDHVGVALARLDELLVGRADRRAGTAR